MTKITKIDEKKLNNYLYKIKKQDEREVKIMTKHGELYHKFDVVMFWHHDCIGKRPRFFVDWISQGGNLYMKMFRDRQNAVKMVNTLTKQLRWNSGVMQLTR